MSFLTAQPEELAAAAGKLRGVGAQQVAQNLAAAVPTTIGVVPAAADEVSALQASLFSAYGNLYQQVSAEAAAMYDTFVDTLGTSAGTYADTEAANSAAASSPLSPSAAAPAATTPLSGIADVIDVGIGNSASAMSNLLGLGNGGLLVPADQGAAAEGAAAGAAAESAAAVELGAVPVTGGLGGAPSVGALSVPPAWTGPATLVASASAPELTGWTGAAPAAPQATALLPGMPGLAAATRNSAGFGAPRYGVKPIVMARLVTS
ncbi:PPE family protein, SVP subgroup [Mycobacterium asiaticum]|uniref:PE family protein n=1 Tax=Mycobacterium asiaticum TaxID=1790 RepID=A0A1A3MK70_MYCAS|nr:PE domain-containing protein [Mycobacterium asiaticum]OBK09891.1 PE family protein [Mycobacterium asiaticum]